MHDQGEKLIRPAEAAHLLGMSPCWLRQQVEAGRLKAVRYGTKGHHRYYTADLQRLKAHNETNSEKGKGQ